MLKKPFQLVPEAPAQDAPIEALNERAFGPGRLTKTAYRLREGRACVSALSFVAMDGPNICGSVRYWLVDVGGKPVLLLGPLAVDPAHQNEGIGRALVDESLEKAAGLGFKLVVLVGDAPYYARMGFAQVPGGKIQMPGPVDLSRVLFKELVPNAVVDVQGIMQPASKLVW